MLSINHWLAGPRVGREQSRVATIETWLPLTDCNLSSHTEIREIQIPEFKSITTGQVLSLKW